VQGRLHFFLKTKSVVFHDDFVFFFKKKRETGQVEDDFTYNVVLHYNDKKKSMNSYLQISLLTDPKYKKAEHVSI